MTRALVTNDDGIDATGLHALARLALGAGLDVVVAAPAGERSGASASFLAAETDGRLAHERRTLPDLPDVAAWAVHATPAYIVRAVLSGAFGPPPDLVLSGVNHGPNTGMAILHSGTVGAALTAGALGVRALAVSADLGADGRVHHWATVESVAGAVLGRFLDARARIANLNVPDVPLAALTGTRVAALAPVGAVEARIAERGEGNLTFVYEPIAGRDQPEGTDARLLADGHATVTLLRPVATDPDGDATALLPL